MRDKSPFWQLAVSEYLRTFRDLLSSTAELSRFERVLIEGTYELIFLGHYKIDQLKQIETTSRVAYKILQDGALRSFEAVVTPFVFNIERVTRSLNRGWRPRKGAFEEHSGEKRVLAFLSFYKTLYEGVMPVLLAPIIASMAISGGKKAAKVYRIDQEGKVSPSQLERVQYEWTSQKKQLAQGLNSHLRNSYAHECYRFLDGGRIELWDMSPRTGNYSWGPVTYTEELLIEECETLWRNALGLVYAWALFSINNRKIIEQGKYSDSLPIASDPLRTEEIKDLSEVVLSERGLDVISFQFEDGQMILKLRCQSKGVDQDSEMVMQSGYSVRKFIVRMKYHEVPIIEQLMGAFKIIRSEIRRDFEFVATVLSIENVNLGEVRGHTREFQKYEGKKLPSISEFRKELLVDTLGSSTTWMLDEGSPREV
jgi:hypothetical protein